MKLANKAEEKGWNALYLDLQGLKDEGEFISLIIRKLNKIKEKTLYQNWQRTVYKTF